MLLTIFQDLPKPKLRISVYNEARQVLEDSRELPIPVIREASFLIWNCSWDMHTPFENLQSNVILVIELLSAEDKVIAWSQFHVNREVVDSMSTEMVFYSPPVQWLGVAGGSISASGGGLKAHSTMQAEVVISRRLKRYNMTDLRTQLADLEAGL